MRLGEQAGLGRRIEPVTGLPWIFAGLFCLLLVAVALPVGAAEFSLPAASAQAQAATLLSAPVVSEPTQSAAPWAVVAPQPEFFRCDGAPLTATVHGGAVDDPTIPNRSAGTLPGAFVQLSWQKAAEVIALQLPRTNNAGAPSFTDGKWWWSLEDPDHPRFLLRQGRGDIQSIACERG